MNKTIYMTYKKEVPKLVFSRWADLNKEYNIDFSLDNDCINFLKTNFNSYISDLFEKIPQGMYKADLWRLCKLYINSGVYADVDLVPHINIDNLDKDITFYSCLSIVPTTIFQAFMVNFSKPKNPLILCFLLSFLQDNPYRYSHGPTHNMYLCLKHNLNGINPLPNVKYEIEEVKILIKIGSSDTNTKTINLHYFPDDITYTIKLNLNKYKDAFKFDIVNNILTVTRLDALTGWGHNHSCNIIISSKETIFLFQEIKLPNNNASSCYVEHNDLKILDSRDKKYYYNGKCW